MNPNDVVQGLHDAVAKANAASAHLNAIKEWDESKHPRDHGKFSSGGGGQGSVDSEGLKLTRIPHPEGLNLNAHSVKDANGQIIGRIYQREDRRPSEAAFQGSQLVTRKVWHSDLDGGGPGGSRSFLGEPTRAKAVEEVARKFNRAIENGGAIKGVVSFLSPRGG